MNAANSNNVPYINVGGILYEKYRGSCICGADIFPDIIKFLITLQQIKSSFILPVLTSLFLEIFQRAIVFVVLHYQVQLILVFVSRECVPFDNYLNKTLQDNDTIKLKYTKHIW